MLFAEKKSALVRLSDAIKAGLDTCAGSSAEAIRVFAEHEPLYRKAQEALAEGLGREIADLRRAHERIRAILAPVPDVTRLGRLQQRLHSQVLSTVLTCCFALESYINSFAYYLFRESDFLGLIRAGHVTSAEVLLEAIERMSTRDKWGTVARLRGSTGFDRSKAPFQDFAVLFRFRDDHVHDKVVELSKDRSEDRYNGKLPDPVFGQLELVDALWAAQTYWDMVQEVHRLLGVDAREFHRHYNLAPWVDDAHKADLVRQAAEYRRRLGRG